MNRSFHSFMHRVKMNVNEERAESWGIGQGKDLNEMQLKST
jgi:hypothetical protein